MPETLGAEFMRVINCGDSCPCDSHGTGEILELPDPALGGVRWVAPSRRTPEGWWSTRSDPGEPWKRNPKETEDELEYAGEDGERYSKRV